VLVGLLEDFPHETTEQCLHHRQTRYYSRSDPLEARGEAAALLAGDLKIILKNIRNKIVNPGSKFSIRFISMMKASIIR
jgi:hypothetical protein